MTDARLLICAATGLDRAGLVREADRPLGDSIERLGSLAARRLAHEPVAKILGRKEFFGLDLIVTQDVLDPRPDTETVVEAAIDALEARRGEALRILDLGSGSGALLCALLAHFQNALGVGIDASEAACKVAKRNLDSLGLSARGAIVRGDWTAALRGPFDLIVSNPPYIARADIEKLAPEVRDYDPHAALDGGDDGLCAYRLLAPELPRLLAKDGIAVFEVGQGQSADVATLFEAAGLTVTDVRRDLAGIERGVVAKA